MAVPVAVPVAGSLLAVLACWCQGGRGITPRGHLHHAPHASDAPPTPVLGHPPTLSSSSYPSAPRAPAGRAEARDALSLKTR